MFRCFNLAGRNDTDWPTFAMRLSADYLELWNPQTGSVHIEARVAQNLQVAINGTEPNPSYKDQAALFTPGTEIHFYWIWGVGPGLNTISSARPPMQGPILPAGFDSYCYATTVLTNAAGALLLVIARGTEVFYQEISHYPVFLINPDRHPPAEPPGHALVETAINVSPAVPQIATTFKAFIDAQLVTTTNNAASSACLLRVVPGKTYAIVSCFSPGQRSPLLLNANPQDYTELFPNPEDGQIYYNWSDIDGTPNILERYLSVFIRGYTLP